MENKQLFLSHAWKPDDLGRNTHDRVRVLKNSLKSIGWSVWFDEDDMKLNIDASMITGIENSEVVLACLTKEYIKQLNESSFCIRKKNKNCAKEWKYAIARNKIVLALVLEPGIMSNAWPPGIITMYICDQLYINAIGDDMDRVAGDITRLLGTFGIFPLKKHKPKKNKLFFRRTRIKDIIHI